MKKEQMRVWRGDTVWLVTSDAPEVRELFGTDTLPTPFTLAVGAETVVAELRGLNPDADVRLASFARR